MASANFLEEALSTDVDESAVSALVGSLEDQLAPPVSTPNVNAASLNQNHVHSAISNGGTALPSQKHGAIANGDTINSIAGSVSQVVLQNTQPVTSFANLVSADGIKTSQDGVNIIYTQGNPAMTSTGTIIANRASFPQTVQNGTIGNVQLANATQAGTNVQTIQTKQQPTLVIKTSVPGGTGTQGLVTVPMNVTTSVPQVNNNVGSHITTHANPNILSNLQVVNVRPGIPTHPQKGQPARVVLSAPQLVGARPGTPQLTLQSLQGLQPGQQGHLLLKTENGQYQLLRVGPAPPTSGTTIANAGVTFRMQTVPANAVATQITNATTGTNPIAAVTAAAAPTVAPAPPPAAVAKPANDNTKEKCRKFLANLLELSSREPKPVERNVRTLIQDLIDMKVEPEDFCDRLEKLLNASPQPCLIGFLKKSLPLLRHSLATKELTIDGIRPPPTNVVYSIASGTTTVQSQVRSALTTQQVRLVTPGTTVMRPSLVQPRLVTPIRAGMPTRMVTTIRQPNTTQPVIVSSSQPPALHPVQFPGNQIIRQGHIIRPPIQVRTAAPTVNHTIRPNQVVMRTSTPVAKNVAASTKAQGPKPVVPSNVSKVATKDKEKKTVSSSAAAAAAAAYAGGDDDINDVAAMGGVNLAEETQRILGSTEFVGTQIRSCKEDFFLSINPLQTRLRQKLSKIGFDEASNEVAAIISHAAQERLKNLVEKLAIITEHRLEMVKSDPRYEVTSDIKGQLKFLEELDRTERKRHEEIEREMLLRAAKSRSKTEDPEQAKLKAKAKEMQRVEMEELRQREANATALQAIGPRKKPKLDSDLSASTSQATPGFNSGARGQLPLKQRMKKVTLRDVQFLFETEKDLCKSTLLYKSYLK